MQRVSEATLLDIWDTGQTLSYNQRALLLLRLGEPETAVEHWLDVPVGQRNAALLRLRQAMYGNPLMSVEPCPDCGQLIECSLSVDDLLQHEQQPPATAVDIELQGKLVPCRLPTPRDIDAVLDADNNDATTALLTRCLQHSMPAKAIGSLDPDSIQYIDETLAAADPLANISFLLHCDNCQCDWEAPFDALSYLWEECAMDARRLLMQVHTLASVYHWSETYILQLSERRRQFYLECIGA